MIVDSINGNRLVISLNCESDTDALGQALAAVLRRGDVVGLVGTLGAGKTRLSRTIAETLGVDPLAVASPTFVLIHEYDSPTMPVYHFDTYRLADASAFDALGAADYWTEGNGLCLIEWADLVADRLPESSWWVRITMADEPTARRVEIQHSDETRMAKLRSLLTS